MTANNSVTIPIEIEHFLSFMFGKTSTHGLAGINDKKIWAKQVFKLTTHLEKYINANVTTDETHKNNN